MITLGSSTRDEDNAGFTIREYALGYEAQGDRKNPFVRFNILNNCFLHCHFFVMTGQQGSLRK
jgi:hypothetical protein